MKRPERFFEWIDGENFGQVEVLKSISELDGEYFYNFESGEICNQRYIAPMTLDDLKLKKKFMVEVTDPANVWRQEKLKARIYRDEEHEVTYQIPTLEDILQTDGTGDGVAKGELKNYKWVSPPNRRITYASLPSYEMYRDDADEVDNAPVAASNASDDKSIANEEKHAENGLKTPENAPTAAVMSPSAVTEPVSTDSYDKNNDSSASSNDKPIYDDPVSILVHNCKKHDTEINMTVNINLPSRSVYAIASSEFENGSEKFIDCVVSEIDPEDIIQSLRQALKDAYTEFR